MIAAASNKLEENAQTHGRAVPAFAHFLPAYSTPHRESAVTGFPDSPSAGPRALFEETTVVSGKLRRGGPMNRRRCRTAALAGAMFPLIFVGSTRAAAPAWSGYANDSFHAANAPAASDPLSSIRWQTPVDLSPQFSGND